MVFESDIERLLVDGVERIGGACIKLGQDGWPDRLVVLSDGRVVWVELKRPDGQVDPLQKWRAARLRKLGHRVEIPWSKADVVRLLDEWK